MWEYNQTNGYELYHYGVKGMRWGVRRRVKRAYYTEQRNAKLEAKAKLQDRQSTRYAYKSAAANNRMFSSARKGARLANRASNLRIKLSKTTDADKALKLKSKINKYQFNADAATARGNAETRQKGYTKRASALASKSDAAKTKASKMRMKMTNNEVFKAKMENKVQKMTPEKKAQVDKYIQILKDKDSAKQAKKDARTEKLKKIVTRK